LPLVSSLPPRFSKEEVKKLKVEMEDKIRKMGREN